MDYKEYLESHELNQDYVEKEWGWKLYPEKEVIIIPVKDKFGDLLYNDYRWLSDEAKSKFTHDKDTTPTLYGIDKAKDKKVIVYCEGHSDCVKLWQEGIPAVTSNSGAATFTKHMSAELEGKTVFLCMDSDEAGQKVVEHHYNLLLDHAKEIGIVDVPKEYKDICEMFKAGNDKNVFATLCKDSPRSLDSWRVSNMPEQHRIESLGELFEADIPDEEWILDKIIPKSGFSIIAGASAVGKSFLALDMARAIATGTKWLDKYETISQEKILFIDKENERASFRKRARGLKLQECQDKIFRLVSPEIFSLAGDGKEKFSEFAKDISAFVNFHNIQVIVFDSLVDFMEGDENSAGDTMFFFNAIREILPGRSILFPAHYGKASKLDNRTPLERIAGSRNLGAQITSGLAVERSTEADNEIIIQSLKARNEINDTTKYKVLIHSKVDPDDERGTIVVGFELTGEVEEKVEKVTGAIDLITKMVDEGGILGTRRKEAIDSCVESGIPNRTAERAIGEMIKSGMFESVKVEGARHGEKSIVRRISKLNQSIYE